MNDLQDFSKIASYLTYPLVLVGFVLFLFFGIHKLLINSGIIGPVSEFHGNIIIKILLQYGFLISLVTIIAGFSLKAWEAYIDTNNHVKEKEVKIAIEEIDKEILNNFMHLSVLINTIEKHKPAKFWDIRRANETESAFQDRAENNFRDYQYGIRRYLHELKYSKAIFESFHRNLSYTDTNIRDHIENTYHYLDETLDSFKRFEDDLSHVLSLKLRDQERTETSISFHQEKVANSKIAIFTAAAHFCTVLTSSVDILILSEHLRTIGTDINLQAGKIGHSIALREAARFAQEKVLILSGRSKNNNLVLERGNDKYITDPYLLMLRKATGLDKEGLESPTRRTNIDNSEHDSLELFKMAAHSYLELDGHAAAIYFERALNNNTSMSDMMKGYARLSIDRLKHYEKYEGSIGIIVLKMNSSGAFYKAGIKTGDVLLSIDGKTIYEPMDIASELGKDNISPFLFRVLRDDQPVKIVVHGGESAGALLSQLVILNGIQI